MRRARQEPPASVQVLSELSPFQRERGAAQMLQPGYIRSLLDIFQVHWLPAFPALCAHLMEFCKAVRCLSAMWRDSEAVWEVAWQLR